MRILDWIANLGDSDGIPSPSLNVVLDSFNFIYIYIYLISIYIKVIGSNIHCLKFAVTWVTYLYHIYLHLKVIGSNIHTSFYDKRDDFGFPIINFPWLIGDIPRFQ